MVLSSEEARSHGVKSLCLVDKCWNGIANATSDLWTKVTLAYPLRANQLSASQKWLKASEPKVIDVEIDICYPGFFEWIPSADMLQGMIAILSGSEHRWRSISVKSDTSGPIREFLRSWVTPSLPALESISFERLRESHVLPTVQPVIEWPALFGGNGTLIPKLREVTLCTLPMDWASAAANPFQNLRKLVISHYYRETSLTLGQFSAVLAASPRLETLDVGAHYPIPSDSPTQAQIPFVHLPALKHLVFGWIHVDRACNFLKML